MTATAPWAPWLRRLILLLALGSAGLVTDPGDSETPSAADVAWTVATAGH